MDQKKEKDLKLQPDALEPDNGQALDQEQLDKVAGGIEFHRKKRPV